MLSGMPKTNQWRRSSSGAMKNLRYNAPLYAESNKRQRTLNLQALDLFQMAFTPRDTSQLQFLDLGCGTGDFTRDFLLPRCQPCRRIVAVDGSEDMLSFARQNSGHANIEFDFLNISEDVGDFVLKYGTFDRVYSFFCLNWASDQRKAMKNVSELLSPSGECLLVFPAWSFSKMVWRKLAQMDRWKAFSNIFEEYIPGSQDLENDKERLSYLEDIVRDAGLIANTCELLYIQTNHGNFKEVIDMQVSLNPAASLISPSDLEMLKDDLSKQVSSSDGVAEITGRSSVYLVHARKSQE